MPQHSLVRETYEKPMSCQTYEDSARCSHRDDQARKEACSMSLSADNAHTSSYLDVLKLNWYERYPHLDLIEQNWNC